MNTKLIKNYIIYFSSTILSAVAALSAYIIYTKLFTPETYGKYDLVNTTYTVLYAFLCGWISSSFFRYYLGYKSDGRQDRLFNSIFTILVIINISLVAIFFILYKFIVSWDMVFLIFIFSFNLMPKNLVDLFVTKFKLDDSMKSYFFATVLVSFGTLGLSLLLILVAKLGIVSLVLAPIISNGLVVLFLGLRYKSFFRFKLEGTILKEFWSYGGPLVITGLINVALALSDRYIIRFYFSDHEVGIYGFAYNMSDRFYRIFVNVFSLTVQTYLMQVWHSNKDKYNSTVKTFTRYYYICFIPLIFIMQIALDFMFSFNIFDRAYIEGKSLTLAVLAAMFFEGLINIANRGFSVNQKTYYLRNVSMVAIIFNVGFNFLLMPLFGYKTAAYTTLVTYALYVVLVYIYSIKKINWKWEFYDRVLFTSTIYWVLCYLAIHFTGLYALKFALTALACALYIFVLPGDIRKLVFSYKDVLVNRLKAINK